MSEATKTNGTESSEPSLNDERSQLLADLAAEDRGAASSSVIPEGAEHAAPVATEGEGGAEGQEAQAQGDNREGEQPKDSKDPKATTEEAKAKEREEKALRRADEEWKRIQSEKEALRKEREAVEAAKRDAAKPKYGPEDYERLAATYKAEGRDDMAEVALKEAEQLRAAEAASRNRAQTDELTRAIQANFAKATEENPDLRNPESELYKRVDGVLKARPVFFSYAEGVTDVITSVKQAMRAQRVEALEAEVSNLKQQLAEKTKLLQPSRGGVPVPARGTETIEDMPLDKMRSRLLAELRGEDARA